METMKAIAKRKSTRAFNPEKGIAKADLDAILAAGSCGRRGLFFPSSHNYSEQRDAG